MTPDNLTPKQQLQLAALYDAKAVSREAAASVHSGLEMFAPLVLGKLRDAGLARSRVARPPGGSQRTEYWLTDAGVDRALQQEDGR